MTYTTLAQLTDRYGLAFLVSLTDRATPPTGAVDTAVVDRALADTDAAIDGYLAGRYQLPLSETLAQIADLAQAIAIYKLHSRTVSDKIAEDYKQALATLKQIATGVQRLSKVTGVEPASSGSSGVQATDRERPMTNENLKGFV